MTNLSSKDLSAWEKFVSLVVIFGAIFLLLLYVLPGLFEFADAVRYACLALGHLACFYALVYLLIKLLRKKAVLPIERCSKIWYLADFIQSFWGGQCLLAWVFGLFVAIIAEFFLGFAWVWNLLSGQGTVHLDWLITEIAYAALAQIISLLVLFTFSFWPEETEEIAD